MTCRNTPHFAADQVCEASLLVSQGVPHMISRYAPADFIGTIQATLGGTSKNRCFQLNIGSGALQFPFVLIS